MSDKQEIWDCPRCQTRHAVAPGMVRVCICGVVRQLDGTVILPDRPTSPDLGHDLTHYDKSATGKVLRWGRAVGRWITHGRPVRTAQQIAGLMQICAACLHYRDGACDVCQCNVNLTRDALFNKLAMGTEGCPLAKWLPVVKLRGRRKQNCGGCGHEKQAARAVRRARRRSRRDRTA